MVVTLLVCKCFNFLEGITLKTAVSNLSPFILDGSAGSLLATKCYENVLECQAWTVGYYCFPIKWKLDPKSHQKLHVVEFVNNEQFMNDEQVTV